MSVLLVSSITRQYCINFNVLTLVLIGLPHVLIEEDEYKGYRIPAGTIVIANSW